jgi:hypothetical protein
MTDEAIHKIPSQRPDRIATRSALVTHRGHVNKLKEPEVMTPDAGARIGSKFSSDLSRETTLRLALRSRELCPQVEMMS